MSVWQGLASTGSWQWPNVIVGGATVAAALLAPRFTRALPPPIWGLAGGIMTYFVLSLVYPEDSTAPPPGDGQG